MTQYYKCSQIKHIKLYLCHSCHLNHCLLSEGFEEYPNSKSCWPWSCTAQSLRDWQDFSWAQFYVITRLTFSLLPYHFTIFLLGLCQFWCHVNFCFRNKDIMSIIYRFVTYKLCVRFIQNNVPITFSSTINPI